jgi:hypothetical protein
MSNKNLFKEAIADAKAVREAALANAKAALEEALTPKLQSMLAAKLNEMEYEEEGHMGEEEMEEGFATNQFMSGDEDNSDTDQNKMDESEDLEEDFDLSEILAELEEEDENLNEAKEEDKEEDEKESEEEPEEEKVAEMSIEDLKALIKDIVGQEIESEEEEMPADETEEEAGEEMSMDMGSEKPESDEINLDELLAELDALGEGEKEEMEEGVLSTIGGAIKKGVEKLDVATGGSPKDCIERGMKAGERGTRPYFAELNKCRKEKGLTPLTTHVPGQAFGVKEAEELQEAISVINTLRSELNEVNLLNAKLLYVNKIFKAKNLSESQKLKVIASFDKATTAKEAKVVFESLSANLTTSAPKQAIKESLGFASRAAGNAPRKAIVETNDAITRMQKLANIIK